MHTTEFKHKYNIDDKVIIESCGNEVTCVITLIQYRSNGKKSLLTYDMDFADNELQKRWEGFTNILEDDIVRLA